MARTSIPEPQSRDEVEEFASCDNCQTDEATIVEGGLLLCETCAEDLPDLMEPINRARRDEVRAEAWKDRRCR